MDDITLKKLKSLVNGSLLPQSLSEKVFLVGHSAALKLTPFSQAVLLNEEGETNLFECSKEELLFFITGYAMGEMQAKDLIDTGTNLNNLEH